MTTSLAGDIPVQADRAGHGEPTAPDVRPRPRLAAWLPVLLLGPPTAYALHRYGAPAADLAVFAAYVLGLIAAPGVLLWRAARRQARSLAEDAGPGLALGYVLEVAAYFAARALGQPRAVVLAPLAVLVLFAAVRPLRRYWRAEAGAQRAPLGWIWANTGIAAAVLLWSAVYFMRTRGVDYAFNDADLPFQLALVGELRHHLPPQVPWLQGEPLSYHWFSYADMAAASWVTGVDPQTLLLRLSFVPLLGGLPFAVSALTRQVTGRWWPGPLAALLTFAGVAPYPYGWRPPETYVANGLGPVEDGVVLRFGLFSSPTQTFAALIGVGLVMVLVDLLRSTGRRRGHWLLLCAFVAVICGAKATYLPLVMCGLLLVTGVTLIGQRRWHRPALAAMAVVLPGILFAQFVLFGGVSQGMVIDPLGGLSRYGLGASTGLGALRMGTVPATGWSLAVITAVTLLAWVMMWGGAAATWVRGRWRDPAHVLLTGIGVAGFGAVLLINHYGFSQTWFLVAARPFLVVAAVSGLALLTDAARQRRDPGAAGPWTRRVGLVVTVAMVSGAAGAAVIRELGRDTAPTVAVDGRGPVLVEVVSANLWLVGLVAALTAIAWYAARGWAAVFAVAVMLGISVVPSTVVVSDHVRAAAGARWAPEPDQVPSWPAGTRESAAWIRGHTDPDDLVATNAHCRKFAARSCDNLHFWFAAFAERRFLVEGWGYTPTVNRLQVETGMSGNLVPYWDAGRLAVNDAAFHRPGPDTLRRLRGLGVRWLMVDRRDGAVREDLLARYATLRFGRGETAVYEL
ncbi:hypothetical protein EV385_4435 [Krasilnikovia cinnamomea]|uniref:4-amino-4-deoxy-L-arabinose transferase-like glycosyltransferase n=1 Tax=Krasilnikovia cinnamomea TaxID=349313 RepID=A0A4Q7ZNF0_9ACTN|nr:hypothetical protein [Krasilnikovia cinnamomea]RZU52562.1 hypothetical protein EV385_4435 [Krasilnikovia cinnamomea]